jgi:hypothetical protein
MFKVASIIYINVSLGRRSLETRLLSKTAQVLAAFACLLCETPHFVDRQLNCPDLKFAASRVQRERSEAALDCCVIRCAAVCRRQSHLPVASAAAHLSESFGAAL